MRATDARYSSALRPLAPRYRSNYGTRLNTYEKTIQLKFEVGRLGEPKAGGRTHEMADDRHDTLLVKSLKRGEKRFPVRFVGCFDADSEVGSWAFCVPLAPNEFLLMIPQAQNPATGFETAFYSIRQLRTDDIDCGRPFGRRLGRPGTGHIRDWGMLASSRANQRRAQKFPEWPDQ